MFVNQCPAAVASAALFLTTLPGCAAFAEHRIEASLTDAGIPSRVASCMAQAWTKELSVEQLRRISDFAEASRIERQKLTVPRLIGYIGASNDPAAMAVIATSAARCAPEALI